MTRRLVVLPILVALVLLIPLAYASPPDPTWIAGLYDNADYDDVVLTATSTAGALDTVALFPEPILVAVHVLAPARAGAPPPVPSRPHRPRGPPTA